jgi:hypothetical protein
MLEVQKPNEVSPEEIPAPLRDALIELAEAEAECACGSPAHAAVSIHKEYAAHSEEARMAWRATLRRESAMANLLALGRLVLAWRSRSVAA